MAADPNRVSALRSIAAHISWARTADRSERTAPARGKSPTSLDYWIKHVRDEGIVAGEEEIRRAAEHYHRAHMRAMSLRAAAARTAKAAKKSPRPVRRTA